MSIEGIKRPEDWPFEIPAPLADAINELIAAESRDDRDVDLFLDNVACVARMLPSEQDYQVYCYYVLRGWEDER